MGVFSNSMPDRRTHIAELYYLSGGIRFEESEQRVPPYTVKLPEAHQPSAAVLPELHGLVGDEFYAICLQKGIRPDFIAAASQEVRPSMEAHVSRYQKTAASEQRVQVFNPDSEADSRTASQHISPGQTRNRLVIDTDYISDGAKEHRVIAAAHRAGLVVRNVLTIIGCQPYRKNPLEKCGIEVFSILTADELLDHGVDRGSLDNRKARQIRGYLRLQEA